MQRHRRDHWYRGAVIRPSTRTGSNARRHQQVPCWRIDGVPGYSRTLADAKVVVDQRIEMGLSVNV